MQGSSSGLMLHLAPLVPTIWLWGIAIFGAFLLGASAFRYKRGLVMRLLVFIAFVLILLNPSILHEEREFAKDIAVVVVDKSVSQSFGKRNDRTELALKSIREQLEKNASVELRVIEAPDNKSLAHDTKLFSALDMTLADVPQKRRAGVIFLTDGQIHDVPKNLTQFTQYGAVHVLLSGEHNEKDRQIVINSAPAYGLVGQNIQVKYTIEDTKNINAQNVQVTLTMHDGTEQTYFVPPGVEQTIELPIDHPSQNIFTLSAETVDGEITTLNNKVPVMINGVRDRLKVLLVSGKPHSGERTWRDLLTSDPGVDLVHFTILREPTKMDYTPQNELSLIPFPFRELFEIKLYDFDLIIFDQYSVNNILPNHYFRNITRYIEEGGAFLESSGAEFAGDHSIFQTPLSDILPASPTGEVFTMPFKPTLSKIGQQHPVTRSLVWNGRGTDATDKSPPWGQWLRQVGIKPNHGDVLMNGAGGRPLLVLDRIGKGRIAQLASDHVWLWSRGYDGGGPHAELLRRIVHWLMKEPELDERALDVIVDHDTITIRKQNIEEKESETIAVTKPDGEQFTLDLLDDGKGWLTQKMQAETLGIYAFEDLRKMRKFAIIGDVNPPELRGVITTPKILEPLVTASRGGTIWLEKIPAPKVRFADANAGRFAGNDWIALRRNKDYTVSQTTDTPLLPDWIYLLGLLCFLVLLWWREGHKQYSQSN